MGPDPRQHDDTSGGAHARTSGDARPQRRTLILCVDRDDDLGDKAGVEGPVVGRPDLLDAAQRLALADPEDSDTNSLFATLKLHTDSERDAAQGMQYMVACVTGHRRVGPKSDTRIVAQFESLLERLRPDRLIVVTDGAEDEHILPLLESRLPIDAVHRVVVKQSRDLEGAYYLLVRLFEDDRMRKRYILPSSLAILVFGAAFALGHVTLAVGGMLFTLGLFLLIHAMGWETALGRVARDYYDGLRKGKVSFFTTVLALALIAFGVMRAYSDLHRNPDLSDPVVSAAMADPLLLGLLTINIALWWVVAGLTLNIIGRGIDGLTRRGHTLSLYGRLLFGLPALGLILQGLLSAATAWRTGTPLPGPVLEPTSYLPVATGVLLAILGNQALRLMRGRLHDDDADADEPKARTEREGSTNEPTAPRNPLQESP